VRDRLADPGSGRCSGRPADRALGHCLFLQHRCSASGGQGPAENPIGRFFLPSLLTKKLEPIDVVFAPILENKEYLYSKRIRTTRTACLCRPDSSLRTDRLRVLH
jgi:hypothetical protein